MEVMVLEVMVEVIEVVEMMEAEMVEVDVEAMRGDLVEVV